MAAKKKKTPKKKLMSVFVRAAIEQVVLIARKEGHKIDEVIEVVREIGEAG